MIAIPVNEEVTSVEQRVFDGKSMLIAMRMITSTMLVLPPGSRTAMKLSSQQYPITITSYRTKLAADDPLMMKEEWIREASTLKYIEIRNGLAATIEVSLATAT